MHQELQTVDYTSVIDKGANDSCFFLAILGAKYSPYSLVKVRHTFVLRILSLLSDEIAIIVYPIEHQMTMRMLRVVMSGYDILSIANPHLFHPFLGNLYHQRISFFVIRKRLMSCEESK